MSIVIRRFIIATSCTLSLIAVTHYAYYLLMKYILEMNISINIMQFFSFLLKSSNLHYLEIYFSFFFFNKSDKYCVLHKFVDKFGKVLILIAHLNWFNIKYIILANQCTYYAFIIIIFLIKNENFIFGQQKLNQIKLNNVSRVISSSHRLFS